MLTRPSQLRVLLPSGNEYGLDAAERRRGRPLDANVDELALAGLAGEVHGRVAPCPPAETRGVRAARAFDEHLLDAADAAPVPLERDALAEVDQTLDPLRLDLVRQLAGHRRRLSPAARREGVRERDRS